MDCSGNVEIGNRIAVPFLRASHKRFEIARCRYRNLEGRRWEVQKATTIRFSAGRFKYFQSIDAVGFQ